MAELLKKEVSRRNFLKMSGKGLLGAALSGSMVKLAGSTLAFATGETNPADIDETVYGIATSIAGVDDENRVSVTIAVADGKNRSYTSKPLSARAVDILTQGADTKSIAFVNYPVKPGALVEVLFDKNEDVIGFNVAVKSGTFFSAAKYGGELSPRNGEPGCMTAAGWLVAKDDAARTITLSDGNDTTKVFRETYTLADDCAIYVVNNAGAYTLKKGSFDKVPVTACDSEGHIYHTKERWQTICVFDGNYKTFETAKVKTLYVMAAPTVIEDKYCLEPDNMPVLSPYQATHEDDPLPHLPESAPYLTSTVPFPILEDMFYYVGDNEVGVYLFKSADGKLSMLDSGWPLSGYQYWKNIEKMGIDPRQISTIMLTHGHGDHYGTGWELVKMIRNCGGDPVVYESYEDSFGCDRYGFPELTKILTDAATLDIIDEYYVYDQWMSLGEGIEIYPFLTQGHTQGSPSAIFKFTIGANNPVFKPGDVVSFEYMGGYGAMATLNKGFTRLSFAYSLRYIQQIIIPYMESFSDYIFPLPQHTNQYPILEVNKAAQIAGVPLMSVLTEGREGIINYLEKRQSTQTSERLFQMWKNGTDMTKGKGEITSPKYQTNEAFGPFKRPAGRYVIEAADDGMVLHGYDAWLNPCEKFAGQTNLEGEDMSRGFVIAKDSYTHDPDGWFVQVSVHVQDDYDGAVRCDNNFYKEYPSKWTSGPVESVHPNWVEILRTERFDTKEEAEAVLATIQKGNFYEVELALSSDILNNKENALLTFSPVTK